MSESTFSCFDDHCVKSVRIRRYSGPYFPAFGLNKERNPINPRNLTSAEANISEVII